MFLCFARFLGRPLSSKLKGWLFVVVVSNGCTVANGYGVGENFLLINRK